jgi:VanZ family protein
VKKLVAWVPFLAGMSAIWLVSSMSRPPIPELHFWNSDKLFHLLAYGVLGALAFVGSAVRHGSLGPLARFEAGSFAGLYGLVDEIHQRYVPGRTASPGDLLADAIGAMLGACLVGLLLASWRAARPGRASPQPS